MGRRRDDGSIPAERRPFGRATVIGAVLAVLGGALAGCATGGAQEREADAGAGGPASLAALGIPKSSVPPPGKCRVWRPTSPSSQQLGVGSCRRLARRVGEGGWLLHHPVPDRGERDRVRLVVYGEEGPSLVRVFDRGTGELVRERMARGDRRPPGEVAARRRDGAEGDTARGGRGAAGGAGEAPREKGPERARTLYSLGIPRGAVPPGRCRVWDPALAADEQAPAGPCDQLRDRVEGEEWLLHHRPAENVGAGDGRLVVALHERGRVVAIRVFNAATGTLIEERVPDGR